jgi:hypothetical protein
MGSTWNQTPFRATTGASNESCIEDLRWYWNDREAAFGDGSSYGVGIDRLYKLTTNPGRAAAWLEATACWSNPDVARAACIGAGLRRLAPADVQVLYAAFGPRLPGARTDLLSDRAARLASYTDTIAHERAVLVRATAEARFARSALAEHERLRSAGVILEETRARLESLNAEIARLSAAKRSRGLSAEEGRALGRLQREREGARRRRRETERPALRPGQLARIEASLRVQVERELSVSDAVNALLGPRLEKVDTCEIAARRAALGETLRTLEAEATRVLAQSMRRYCEACGAW